MTPKYIPKFLEEMKVFTKRFYSVLAHLTITNKSKSLCLFNYVSFNIPVGKYLYIYSEYSYF